MRSKLSKFSTYALIAMLVLSAAFIIAPAQATPTTLEVIANEGLAPGTHDSNFTTALKSVGDTFVVNVTVFGPADMDLFAFQVRIDWDPTLLDFVSVTEPSDYIFAGQATTAPAISVSPGSVVYGLSLASATENTFNGTGTVCQLTLKIIKEVSMLSPQVHCDLPLVNPPPYSPADTFLLNREGLDIYTGFTAVDGRYFYTWVTPTTTPRFYLSPSTIKPAEKGDLVPVDIMVDQVDPAWQIIAFQCAIMWNTTFLAPAAPYYANGTFLEAFEYYPSGVLYVSSINEDGALRHVYDPSLTNLAPGYNYSLVGLILMPDPATNTTHAPYPHGAGKLFTLYFTAIYDTISPVEDWTYIEFITMDDAKLGTSGAKDNLVLNTFGINIGYSGTTPAHYRAPVRVLGLAIDLYTQYPYPYGGQGSDMPSDMFGPQQLVDLFALVTYNEFPVQQKLVGFEIHHGNLVFLREASTDTYGIAHVSFRLPWPCVDPVGEIFGKWIVIATVDVAETVKNDTLGFWVWWPVQVLSIEPKSTRTPPAFYHNLASQSSEGEPMTFTMIYQTYSMQTIPVTLTSTIYDELGFFIGSSALTVSVGYGSYQYYDYWACQTPTPLVYTWNITIPMPSQAVVGKGTAFGDAYNAFPWLGGVAYCPEATNTIDWYIKKGPPP